MRAQRFSEAAIKGFAPLVIPFLENSCLLGQMTKGVLRETPLFRVTGFERRGSTPEVQRCDNQTVFLSQHLTFPISTGSHSSPGLSQTFSPPNQTFFHPLLTQTGHSFGRSAH